MQKAEGAVPQWEHDVTVQYLQGLLSRCQSMLQRTLASHGREQKERDELLEELQAPMPGPQLLSDLLYGPAPAPRREPAPTPEEIAAAESLAAHGQDRRDLKDRRCTDTPQGGLMERVAQLEQIVCKDREFYEIRYGNVIDSIDTTDRMLRGAEERLNAFIDRKLDELRGKDNVSMRHQVADLERMYSEVLVREKAASAGYRTVLQDVARMGASLREVRELADALATRVRQLNSEQPRGE